MIYEIDLKGKMKRGFVFGMLVILLASFVYGVPVPGHAGVDICDNYFCVLSTGSVGIGTTTPNSNAKLDVKGDVWINYLSGSQGMVLEEVNGISTLRFDSTKFRIYEGYGGGETELLTVLASGNIGIGKTNPSVKLDVSGAISAAGAISATGLNGNINAAGDVNVGGDIDVTGNVNIVSGNDLCLGASCRSDWPVPGSSLWTTGGSDIYYNTGNVGIGASSPSAKLDVVGATELNGNVGVTGDIDATGDICTSGVSATTGELCLSNGIDVSSADPLGSGYPNKKCSPSNCGVISGSGGGGASFDVPCPLGQIPLGCGGFVDGKGEFVKIYGVSAYYDESGLSGCRLTYNVQGSTSEHRVEAYCVKFNMP